MNATTENKVTPISTDSNSDTQVGALLIGAGVLKQGDVQAVLDYAARHDLRFGEAAIRMGLVERSSVEYALAKQFEYPYLLPGTGGFSKELIAAFKPFTPRVEALRSLRMQLMFRWFAAGHKALAVVSAGPREGRTYLTANLAVVFSQLGDNTLVIDANLDRPRLHDVFRVDNSVGLSSALVGRTGGQLNIQQVPHFEHLSVLPAGAIPPNADELLARNEFEEILQRLSARYDIILVDTPSGDAGIGAETVAFRCRGALLAVRRNHTSVQDVKEFKERLSNRAQIVGSVLSSSNSYNWNSTSKGNTKKTTDG